MLALTIEGILDFVGPRHFAHFWIANESVRHEANIDKGTFVLFFEVLCETLQQTVGAEWTDEMTAAWKSLIVEIDGFVRDGNM